MQTLTRRPEKFQRSERVEPIDKDEQYTASPLPRFARLVFGAEIDLDPCSSATANLVIQAGHYYTKEQNALELSWAASTLWFNPPYKRRLIDQLIDKFLEERSGIGQAMVLVNSSTCAGWYQKLVSRCDRMLLPRKRQQFWSVEGLPEDEVDRLAYWQTPPGKNQYDQTVFYFGPNTQNFDRLGGAFGSTMASPFSLSLSSIGGIDNV
jgi:hypothetical protein